MDTNVNNTQINTFSGGMDTDSSDMLIGSDSYRMAENLRYLTDADETTGELRLIEGATRLQYSNFYKDQNGKDVLEFLTDVDIVASNSIRDIGAIVYKRKNGDWAVYRIEYTDSGMLEGHRVFGWCKDQLNWNSKLSTVLKWEDEDQLQLYIADGEHALIKINLFNSTIYKDINYVSSRPKVYLTQPTVSEIITGSLKAGLVQYAYYLYNDNNVCTALSPLSNAKNITGPYKKHGGIGLNKDEISLMGLKIHVDIPEETRQLYKYIKLYRIHYYTNGQLPRIYLICDMLYNNETGKFDYSDIGTASLEELTPEQFNSLLGITVIPKIIEQKNNILFAGNVKYDIDTLDDKYLNKVDFRAFSSGDDVEYNNFPDINTNKINKNLDLSQVYNAEDWETIDPNINEESKYGGIGKCIKWTLTSEVDENRILNQFPDNEMPGEDSLKLINKSNDDESVYDKKYLAHDEVYRYGIILYSKYGTKYPTKWICDIRTPNIGNNGLLESSKETIQNLTKLCKTVGDIQNPIGIFVKFTVLPNVLDPNIISGYEIVRVNRSQQDSATITQGIIAATVKPRVPSLENERCSTGFPFIGQSYYVHAYAGDKPLYQYSASTTIDTIQFYSPEMAYFPSETLSILKSNTIQLHALNVVKPHNPNNKIYTKYTDTHIVGESRMIYPTPFWDDSEMPTFIDTSGYRAPNLSYASFVQLDDDGNEITHTNFVFDNNKEEAMRYQFGRNRYATDADIYDSFFGYNLYKMDLFPINLPQYASIKNANITDCDKVSHIDYDKLVADNTYHGLDFQSIVGNVTFYNCVEPFAISADTKNELGHGHEVPFTVNEIKKGVGYNRYNQSLFATCDPSLVLNIDHIDDPYTDDVFNFYHIDTYAGARGDRYIKDTNGNIIGIIDHEYSLLCNIRKVGVIPYGGFDLYTRNTSEYVQNGYYYKVTDVDNEKSIYDGDVKVTTFEFVTAHKWYDATVSVPKVSVICQVPIESRIDISLDNGDKFSNSVVPNASLVQVQPCDFLNKYTQKQPSYVYNTAYSVFPQTIINPGIDLTRQRVQNFDCRVHYSGQAEASQSIDPWLVFQPLNYLDVDSQYGPITNLRTFKNQLLFWQKNATGVLSVKERVQITDKSNLPLILGTGGVLDRYDYITTSNGMAENQYTDTQSEQSIYWWDYDNGVICSYNGSAVGQLSKIKKVQNLLNKWKKNEQLVETTLSSALWPLLIYDEKYNEVLFKIGGTKSEGSGNRPKCDTLVYNEQLAQFTGIYTIDPQAYLNLYQHLLLFDKPQANSNGNFISRKEREDAYYWNKSQLDKSIGFYNCKLLPYLKYVVNKNNSYVKVYDNVEFGGVIPGSFDVDSNDELIQTLSSNIKFQFNTPLRQIGKLDGTQITNREYDFRFAVPRSGKEELINNQSVWVTKEYGDRLRGKTMQCEMSSTSNSLNFSLQYFITKYRISWS